VPLRRRGRPARNRGPTSLAAARVFGPPRQHCNTSAEKGRKRRAGHPCWKYGVPPGRGHRQDADTDHAWRGDPDWGDYQDVPGFCKSATLEEIRRHGYVLTPGRYVGAEAAPDDGEPFEEKLRRLVAQPREQQAEAARLDAAIAANLKELGYG
jgi:hypothetical protein